MTGRKADARRNPGWAFNFRGMFGDRFHLPRSGGAIIFRGMMVVGLVGLVLGCAAPPARHPSPFAAWTGSRPLPARDPRLRELLRRGLRWKVTRENGVILPRQMGPLAPPFDTPRLPLFPLPLGLPPKADVFTLPVDDGWLVAYNSGEWGGEVWHYDDRGGPGHLLSTERVLGLLRLGQRVYAWGRPGVGAPGEGLLCEIRPGPAGRWTVGRTIRLPAPPLAVAAAGRETALILTGPGIWRFRAPDRLIPLYTTADWVGLHPNSLVRETDGTIFVGLDAVVAELTPRDGHYRERWLIPPPHR